MKFDDFQWKGEVRATLLGGSLLGPQWWEFAFEAPNQPQVIVQAIYEDFSNLSAAYSKTGDRPPVRVEKEDAFVQRSYGLRVAAVFGLAEPGILDFKMEAREGEGGSTPVGGISAIEEETIHTPRGKSDAVRITMTGGYGPLGARISSYYAPGFPAGLVKTQMTAYFTLIPLATGGHELIEYGSIASPSPSFPIPQGTWPLNSLEPKNSKKE